jgi:hypothetical protein
MNPWRNLAKRSDLGIEVRRTGELFALHWGDDELRPYSHGRNAITKSAKLETDRARFNSGPFSVVAGKITGYFVISRMNCVPQSKGIQTPSTEIPYET